MITYFHTATHIFAVANGYCSAVLRFDGEQAESLVFVGCPLLGLVRDRDLNTILPLEAFRPAGPESGEVYRLKFALRSGSFLSEPLVQVEEAESLSVRPMQRGRA